MKARNSTLEKYALIFTIVGTIIAAIALVLDFGERIEARKIQMPQALTPETIPAELSESSLNINYYGIDARPIGFGSIVANLGGNEYQIVGEEEGICFNVIDQRDFDSNGVDDVLIEVNACGGNCCANSFLFATFVGDGHFQTSNSFGYSWEAPVIQEWNDKWSILVVSTNEGMNIDRPAEVKQRFILDSGKAIEVEGSERKELVALANLRAEDFQVENDTLNYDLDGDGLLDEIQGRLWARWGRFFWLVNFGDGKAYENDSPCKRIGVLPSTSLEVHDLVCDFDNVYKWNGETYVRSFAQ